MWPLAQQLLGEAVNHFDEAGQMLSSEGRWVVPPNLCITPEFTNDVKRASCQASTCSSPVSFEWASNLNGVWFYSCRSGQDIGSVTQQAISLDGLVTAGSTVWVCGTTLNQLGHWAKCIAVSGTMIRIINPYEFCASVFIYSKIASKTWLPGA